ncbi:RimK family protein [Balneatrix alpica]|uniref:RimK family protein n=1 Tax=Balneatrix alpica TaxID=75684 RepID=A0ABV5ZAE1_9GAMM|nr:RimK family protein [Balneatrix alpica]
MSKLLLLVDKREDWAAYYPTEDLMTAQEYLSASQHLEGKAIQVINLCRSFKYLGSGYYCSLLAEARGHKVIPSVRSLNDLSRKSIYSLDTEDLDGLIKKSLAKDSQERVEMLICFGKTTEPALADLARQLFELFPCPILRVSFKREGSWRLHSIRIGSLHQLKGAEEDQFAQALDKFSRKIWRRPKARRGARYDLAILHDPDEALPPSDKRALKHFIRVGKSLGLAVELIEKRHYSRLAEYDALFIRATTAINHHTYRFAKKAESEGMVVIDDPNSILKCTNKVYLEDLLRTHKLPTPKTVVINREQSNLAAQLEAELGYPLVLKIPDGAFSKGVVKARDRQELEATLGRLFEQSFLLLAQEFLYTDYDWRIGILNNKVIFACQYFMTKGHWQIYNHSKGKVESGGFTTLPPSKVPAKVKKVALKAASLIGDGLYGVDLKQRGEDVYIIEINDNPNIDAGVEDVYLGEELYRVVLEEFVQRLERKRLRL